MGKRNRIFGIVMVLAAFVGPAKSATLADFAQISAALTAGQGEQALLLIDTALRQSGLDAVDQSGLLFDRGLADHLQGDRDGALTDFTEAIDAHDLTPAEQARAYLERGLVLDAMDRLNDAIGDYGAVLSLTPNSAAALNNRANAFRREGQYEDARRDYLASLAADNPAPEYPYYGLGQIAESLGRPEEAKNFYTKALATNPDYKLAADRLAALGGAPITTEAIVLRPPKSVTFRSEDAPIVLHPPEAKFTAAPPVAMSVAPTIKPAAYSVADDRPGLRPALDNQAGQQVQLGAWRQETEAAEGWNLAVKAASGALSGLAPHIIAVDLPGRGRYYRLRVVTPDGGQLCAALNAKGLDCFPVRD